MSRRWTVWLVVAGYAGMIFAVSSIPAKSMPAGRIWDFDKVIHAGEYGIFAALLWWAMGATTTFSHRALALFSIASAGLYGVSDELHQSLVAGRSSSGYDVLADVGGAVVAALLLLFLARRRLRRRD